MALKKKYNSALNQILKASSHYKTQLADSVLSTNIKLLANEMMMMNLQLND